MLQFPHTEMSNKFILVILSISAALSAIWNVAEEPIASNWQEKYLILTLWIIPLFINCLWGTLAKNSAYRRDSRNLSIVYFVIYGFYALNGSSANEIAGAEHMHLFIIPFFVLTIQCFVMLYDTVRHYSKNR